MKKIFCIATATLLLAGCNDWLDVKPRGRMPESEIFQSEMGFQTALIGVYTKMADGGLYGEQATIFFPEYVVGHWSTVNTSVATAGKELTEFNYTGQAKAALADMWLKYYNAIAQINKVIEHLENTDVEFKGDHKRTMLGEALGLRAFMHLDLLRFWGPVPATAVDNTLALPYLTKNTREIAELRSISWKSYTDALWSDLKESAELLHGSDPIFLYDQSEVSPNAEENVGKNYAVDTWEMLRRRRFNYYAAVAVAARMHAWQGNMAAAADSAMVVIKAQDYKGSALFALANSESSNTGGYANYSMNVEHIFGLNNPDLQINLLDKFEGVKISATQYSPKPPVYAQLESLLRHEECLNSDINPSDIRSLGSYWKIYDDGSAIDKAYSYKKYLSATNGAAVIAATNRIPLLRVAEMYLYAFEGKSVADVEVNQLIQDYCAARNISQRLYDPIVMDDTNKQALLEREWRKDFYAEGQMMFYYKRLDADEFTWPALRTLTDTDLIFPRPDDQLVFDIIKSQE